MIFIITSHLPTTLQMYCFQLVGHTVPGGGIAITGQEQNQIGGGFLEGDFAPKGKVANYPHLTMNESRRNGRTKILSVKATYGVIFPHFFNCL